jgi:hypothetical protein
MRGVCMDKRKICLLLGIITMILFLSPLILSYLGILYESVFKILTTPVLVSIQCLTIAGVISTNIVGYISTKDDEKDSRTAMTGMVLANVVLFMMVLAWFGRIGY